MKHELEGFRMLAVSRKMVERMGVLCMVYRLEKKPEIAKYENDVLNITLPKKEVTISKPTKEIKVS